LAMNWGHVRSAHKSLHHWIECDNLSYGKWWENKRIKFD